MTRKRVIAAILVATIAVCLIRVARIGHESDPPVPWWWGWPLELRAHLLNVLDRLRSVLLLGRMALPVAAVVYLIGKGNGLWTGPLRPGRSASTGALAAVVGLFPAAMLFGLSREIVVPFRGPVSSPEAVLVAPVVVFYYGLFGGFPVVALLGALGGAAVYTVTTRSRRDPDRPDNGTAAFLIMSVFIVLIDYGFVEGVLSGPPASLGVSGSYLAIFAAIAILWFSSRYVRARRGVWSLPPGILVFCSSLAVGLVLGVALGETTGFVALGLSIGAVAGGILGVKDRRSGSSKSHPCPPPVDG